MPDQPIPQPNNPTVVGIEQILNALIFGAGVTAAITQATIAYPFLAWPIISSLFKMLVEKVATMVYEPMKNTIVFQVLDWQTEAQAQAYQDAVANLAKAQVSGDPNATQAAIDAVKAKLADLIHFDGTTH